MTQEKKPPLQRETHEIDATGKTVGRLSTQIATLLRGKHKPSFEPHIDAGDFVVVKNAKYLKFTGQKLTQKVYHRHSGYPGGLKTKKLSAIFAQDPSDVLRRSVLQMLPDIRLRKNMINRLTVTN
ncbi:MAG: 50S ribosomal protein L13 [Candidatus Uhrbacteria bacterium]|nr:50S ribosomal protein L13 [Candidatus Uhrbacteria bacterium]